MTNNVQKAVIYCRVSNKTQTTRGDGLGSQETRCREYAKYKSYEVEAVFTDDVSGSLIKRPGMQAMLKHLSRHRKNPRIAIIDDISRLARGLDAHLQLRSAIAKAGATLESPSIEFGEDSDSVLVENLLASVSQHQRQKNSEQTLNRMKSRLKNGYWVFQAPVGYRYQKTTGQGKILVRDEPIASIAKEALEGYASGRFQLQVEVKRFLESFPEYPKDRKGKVHPQRVMNLLTRVLYAGYVESEDWDVSLRPGRHEGLISLETFKAIQDRLKSTAKAPARKDLSADFPLRGFVTCGECGHTLTACWSKGRTAHHPYYMCFQKGCSSYRKSIRRDVIEGEFERFLLSLKPSQELFNAALSMFKDLWNYRLEFQKTHNKSLALEISKTERKIEQLLDRIVNAESNAVISAYEKRIGQLQLEQQVMKEKISQCGRHVRGYDETFRTAMDFLANPHELWASGRMEDRHAVLKLTFADRLAYVRGEGFRTPKTTLPFKALAGFSRGENKMARPEGFEPPTP
ncbi:MAG: recombinase family protein [Candidatus Thiodiazotropha sp. (ex Myrtea sp. 'scaly one' KF741663)]|nr:recombinase family protein [Candidatus Thiodiazotropha sp. (ex Myrtea sp. 'scaly one' KF741663)]